MYLGGTASWDQPGLFGSDDAGGGLYPVTALPKSRGLGRLHVPKRDELPPQRGWMAMAYDSSERPCDLFSLFFFFQIPAKTSHPLGILKREQLPSMIPETAFIPRPRVCSPHRWLLSVSSIGLFALLPQTFLWMRISLPPSGRNHRQSVTYKSSFFGTQLTSASAGYLLCAFSSRISCRNGLATG